MAFCRGYLDGLDLPTLARRYLETTPIGDEEIDLRVGKSMLRWVREKLMVTARRSAHASSAKALRVEPDALRVTYPAATPTLEAFREKRDPHDMFSEQSLIDLFKDEYCANDPRALRRTQRNHRLRSKLLAMLARLEVLADASPHVEDGVGGWIRPLHAASFAHCGPALFRFCRFG